MIEMNRNTPKQLFFGKRFQELDALLNNTFTWSQKTKKFGALNEFNFWKSLLNNFPAFLTLIVLSTAAKSKNSLLESTFIKKILLDNGHPSLFHHHVLRGVTNIHQGLLL